MLRRPPTTLTLTPTDIHAYEVSRAQRLAQAAADAKRRQRQKLKEKQRKEQLSPSRATQNGAPRAARQTGVPVRGGDMGMQGTRKQEGQTQRNAQAQRIFGGRAAGSLGPATNKDLDDDEDEDDDDLDVTLPTGRGAEMRGGDIAGVSLRGDAASQRGARQWDWGANPEILASDTESNTETDTEDDADGAMDIEDHRTQLDGINDEDTRTGAGRSNNMTIQSRGGPSQSRLVRGRGQSSASTTGRNTNVRTPRQATPQI